MSEAGSSGVSPVLVFSVGAAIGVLALLAVCKYKAQAETNANIVRDPVTGIATQTGGIRPSNLSPLENTAGSTVTAGVQGSVRANLAFVGSGRWFEDFISPFN